MLKWCQWPAVTDRLELMPRISTVDAALYVNVMQ